MADSEVKIHVGVDADTKGIDETQAKLDGLRRETERAENKAPTAQPARPQGRSQTALEAQASAKGGAPDETERSAARSARERAGEARKVSTEGREQLSLEEKKKRIQQLHKAADAYDARGDMDVAARSARAEARVLERDVARSTKDREADERRVTREVKEQEAMRRAGIGSSRHRFSRVTEVGQNIISGGNPTSAILGMGMRAGNPVVAVGALAATLVAGVVNTYFSQQEKTLSHENLLNENRARGEFQINRQKGIYGSSAGLVANALSAEQEAAEKEAHKEELKRKTKFGWYNPLRWSDGLLGTKFQEKGVDRGDALFAASPLAGFMAKAAFPEWSKKEFWKSDDARNLETNDKEIDRLKEEGGASKKAAREKFLNEEGGFDLDALRGRSKRTMGGQREAFIANMAKKWIQDYKSVVQESGDQGLAQEMADLATQNELRDKQAQAGAGLVSAKSGGAEIAAAANWAMRGTAGWQEVVAELGKVRADMNNGNQDNRIKNQAK